jgi:pimeloyl-ACP methyl ester carboxylesterase
MFDWLNRGGVVTYERKGSGPPLIILPGVMADAIGWLPVANAITLANPVIVINRRGRAPSPDLGADYGVPTEVEDLARLVSSIGKPVHLFGWSYGGLVAIEAAANGIPLRTLTAYEPVSKPFAPQTVKTIQDALAAGDPDRAVEIINCDVSGFDTGYVQALRRTAEWQHLVELALPLGAEMAAINSYEPQFSRYENIGTATTLIVGQQSQGGAPYGTAFERFVKALPQASVHVLPNQGHLAHVVDPRSLADHITKSVCRNLS